MNWMHYTLMGLAGVFLPSLQPMLGMGRDPVVR